jgi:hypothetical protein
MGIVMAIGVWSIYAQLSNSKKRYSTLIFSVVLVVLLIPGLIAPVYTRYYQSSMGQSIVSSSEFATAQWLKQNTPENTIIVSDFETIELLGTLANKMLPIDRNFMVEGLNNASQQTLWQIKSMFSRNYVNYTLENQNDPAFWRNYGFGKGSREVSSQLEVDNDKVVSVVEGNKSTVGLIHKYSVKQNWSDANGLYLTWCGQNTGETWQICVAAADDSNWFAYSFKDDFTGWANVSMPFTSFTKVGSPDWSTVSYIAIRTSDASPNSWHFSDIGLSYLTSLNINTEQISYLKTHVTSTEQRYSEKTGLSLDNVTILFVVNSRTIQWINQDGITQPVTLLKEPLDPDYLELIRETACLEEIYSVNNDIYVFKVNASLG